MCPAQETREAHDHMAHALGLPCLSLSCFALHPTSATQVQLSGRGLVTGVQAQPGDTRLASTPVNVIAAVFPCLSVTPAKLMRARPATPRFVRRFCVVVIRGNKGCA